MTRIIITVHYRCNYKKITSNYSSSSEIEEWQLILLLAAWRLLLFNILWGKTAWVAIKSGTSMKKDKYTNFLGVWDVFYFPWCLTVDQPASLQVIFGTYFPIILFRFLFQLLLTLPNLDVLSTKTVHHSSCFIEILNHQSQPESITKAGKRCVNFNREIWRCNATILQKLLRAFHNFKDEKEDKLVVVRGNHGDFNIT